jgi:hypothetical protein
MVSCANIDEMFSAIAETYKLDVIEMKTMLKNRNLLPLKMAKELAPQEAPKERIWATKRTEEKAKALGVKLQEIKSRSGKNNTIIVKDIEAALIARKLRAKKQPEDEEVSVSDDDLQLDAL